MNKVKAAMDLLCNDKSLIILHHFQQNRLNGENIFGNWNNG